MFRAQGMLVLRVLGYRVSYSSRFGVLGVLGFSLCRLEGVGLKLIIAK